MQVSEVVNRSKAFLNETVMNDIGPGGHQDLRLEGIELSDDEVFWFVTFSYFLLPSPAREYRTIKIRASDGRFFGARNGVLPMGLM